MRRVDAALRLIPDAAALRNQRCLCVSCLNLDVTGQLTPPAMLDGDNRLAAQILIDEVAVHDETAADALRVLGPEIEASRSQGLAWAWRWGRGNRFAAILARRADAWACLPDAVVLLARGTWRFDDQGRLHDVDGERALRWPSGWTASYQNGIRIPEWSHDPDAITPSRVLEEPNIEVRRVLVERYGIERFLAENDDAELVDDDPMRGQLWRLGLRQRRNWSDDIWMLRVLDATPTPSGDRKVYWLRVPDRMQTAQAAAAWTFGLRPDAYQPEVET